MSNVIHIEQTQPLSDFADAGPVKMLIGLSDHLPHMRNQAAKPLLDFLGDCPADIGAYQMTVGLIAQVCLKELIKGDKADMSKPFEVALQEILAQEAPDSITLLKTAVPGLKEESTELRAVAGLAAALHDPAFNMAVWAAFGIVAARLAAPPKQKGQPC